MVEPEKAGFEVEDEIHSVLDKSWALHLLILLHLQRFSLGALQKSYYLEDFLPLMPLLRLSLVRDNT